MYGILIPVWFPTTQSLEFNLLRIKLPSGASISFRVITIKFQHNWVTFANIKILISKRSHFRRSYYQLSNFEHDVRSFYDTVRLNTVTYGRIRLHTVGYRQIGKILTIWISPVKRIWNLVCIFGHTTRSIWPPLDFSFLSFALIYVYLR